MSMLRLAPACLTLAIASVSYGQALETPQPSPHARVEQRVGLTDVAVDYSSPTVKGRKIWGELVPFDKPWRMGANSATKLIVSKDFSFGGNAVKAGTYSLYAVPGKASWTIVIGANADVWGTEVADKEKVVAQMTVKPTAMTASRERMAFIFSDTSDDGTNLDLEWEKVRVRIPLKVDTKAQVNAAMEAALANAWRPHFQAARYLLDAGDLDRALTNIQKSIAIQPTWWNNWIESQIYAKKGNKAEAAAAAQKAAQLGPGDKVYESYFKADIEKAAAAK
jgi:hypothetical protein